MTPRQHLINTCLALADSIKRTTRNIESDKQAVNVAAFYARLYAPVLP